MKTVIKYIWKYFVKYQISFVSIRQIIKHKICVRKITQITVLNDFEIRFSKKECLKKNVHTPF